MAISTELSTNVVKPQKNTKISIFLTSKATTTSKKHVDMKIKLIYKMQKMPNGGSWSHIDNKLKILNYVLDRIIENHIKWSE